MFFLEETLLTHKVDFHMELKTLLFEPTLMVIQRFLNN